MRYIYPVLLYIVLLSLGPIGAGAQVAACDGDKGCIGNALTSQVTGGKGAQYVDVDTSSVLRGLSTGFTFEAWMKPEAQPGARQFIGGLWGPNQDNNDQWVIYIEGTTITFALSADGSRKGSLDNTVATVNVPNLYTRGWVHLAAAWSGSTTVARIYIDGIEVATGTNPQYPLTILHQPENRALPMQIGSCNALNDDTTSYRTFKGQLDEIRIWNRERTPQEIRCQRILSLNGDEAGLILYYRCNEPPSGQILCDATNHALYGRMRSGAHCEQSDRRMLPTYSVSPSSVTADLVCTNDTLMRFIVTDTSYCGSNVRVVFEGRDLQYFASSKGSMTLQQNVPDTFYVYMKAPVVGDIKADLYIANVDRCGEPLLIPLRFKRKTRLDYSDRTGLLTGPLMLDTLFVGCTEQTSTEDTLRICSDPRGGPVKLDSLRFGYGDSLFTWRPAVPAQKLPLTLPPGGCWSIIVKMNAADSTRTYRDTINVFGGDTCLGGGRIAVMGHTQDVLMLLDSSYKRRLDSLQFERVCPGQLSNPQVFHYKNLSSEPIQIDTMDFSSGFFGRRYAYPLRADPNMYYPPSFVRFKPDRPGPFVGELRVSTKYRGCTIVKRVKLTGTGISVDVSFDRNLVGFGNVTIGKSKGQQVTVYNKGVDPRIMSAYLKVGDVFTILPPATISINPGNQAVLNLDFRPREPKTYYDTLCLFDQQCYQTICIPVSGTGVFEDLSFVPPYLNLENVLGCECRTGDVKVTNISSKAFTFTATLNDPSGKFSWVTPPAQGAMAAGQSFTYSIKYCPNDLASDRVDRAYIDLKLSDGQTYQVLLRGTSAAPKLYVTPLTAYATVEVGWNRDDSILVENISSVAVHIQSVTVPPGYTITGYSRPVPTTVNPRDSIWAYVRFAPTAQATYNGPITVVSDAPCPIQQKGDISGKGVIIKLEVPQSFANYGQVKPCDCQVRAIPLPNGSQYIPISIDSIWIDGQGLATSNPSVFLWRSWQTGGTTLPYQVKPQTADTLLVSFCPNIPAVPANLVNNAVLHIKASTPGWSQEFTTVLSGRREMNFVPDYSLVAFPATRVDTSSAPLTVELSVPDQFTNPSADSVVITGVTFAPDKRVFSYTEANGKPLPWVIHRNEKMRLMLTFYPRAPKTYTARLQLHTSYPCDGIDTTILVTGTGFAPAFGIQMAFDSSKVGRDTIMLTTCDTLELPVMINRDMPQDLIDIAFRLLYDSTEMKLVDVSSPYTKQATVSDTGDGARVYLKDAREVLGGTIALIRFAVTGGARSFPISLDQVDFDSDSLVYYKIVPGLDNGWVIINQPMIAMTKMTAFDTVNLKYCADREIDVWNPGLIPIRFDSLEGIPFGHRITASSIPFPAILAPGDTIHLTVTFCPYIEQSYDTAVTARSSWPCPIADTGRLQSVGFAPPFPMRIILDNNIGRIDTVGGTIADTIEVPLLIDRDIPQTPLDLGFDLDYNRRALQYLSISSDYSPKATATPTSKGLTIVIPHCDSVRKGEIARVRFAVAVPDVTVSPMTTGTFDFKSDSVWWVKLRPTGDTGMVRVDARCNITRLDFPGGSNMLKPPTPNPASGTVVIEAAFVEDARATLRLFNSAGVEVTRLIDGSQRLPGGHYRLEFDAAGLPDGAYFYVLDAGRYHAVERLVIRK
jgi:hypothetical protein